MLLLKPNCECCDTDLPADATNALICSFECTFCETCAGERLGGRCPNCGGELSRRPTRDASLWTKHPPSSRRVFKPEHAAANNG